MQGPNLGFSADLRYRSVIVGRREAEAEIVPLTPANPVGVAFKRSRRPHVRSRAAIAGFAFIAVAGFALVNVIDPFSGTTTTPAYAESLQQIPTTERFAGAPAQELTAPDTAALTITREAVTVKEKPKPTPAPTPSKDIPSPLDGLRTGAVALVDTLQVVVLVLATALPWLVPALVLWLVGRRVVRVVTARAARRRTPPAGPGA